MSEKDLTEWRKSIAEKQRILRIEELELQRELLKSEAEERVKKLDEQIKELKGE